MNILTCLVSYRHVEPISFSKIADIEDIILEILQYLPLKDICQFGLASKTFCKLAESGRLLNSRIPSPIITQLYSISQLILDKNKREIVKIPDQQFSEKSSNYFHVKLDIKENRFLLINNSLLIDKQPSFVIEESTIYKKKIIKVVCAETHVHSMHFSPFYYHKTARYKIIRSSNKIFFPLVNRAAVIMERMLNTLKKEREASSFCTIL